MIDMLSFALIPAEIESPLLFILMGSCAMLLVSMAKSGFGGSVALLSVPMMIYACGGQTLLATGIMLPLLIACDYGAILGWIGKWNSRIIFRMLPGIVVGIALGSAALWGMQRIGRDSDKNLANAILMLGIGIIALGFVILQTIQYLRRKNSAFKPGWPTSLAVGTVAGTTSTLAHAAGPVTAMYLLPQQLDKNQYVASTVLFFWIANQLKLIPYFALGMIDTSSLTAGLSLLPAVVTGTVLGVYLSRKLGKRSFTAVVYTLLTFAAIHLIINGASLLTR